MIKIEPIDLTPLTISLPMVISNAAMTIFIRRLGEAARGHWIKVASEKLQSSRTDYINGIQPLSMNKQTAVITLTGAVPLMVEEGWDARFLHDTLLENGAKTSKDGDRYRSIPFRHKGPDSGPVGGGPMGSQFSNQKKAMSLAAPHAVVNDTLKLGRIIHRAAKKLGGSDSMKTPKNALKMIGGGGLLRQHHTTDIFSGMKVNKQLTHVSSKGKPTFQKTYSTFRTISDKEPGKFYHPGIMPRNFADEVGAYVQKIAVPAFHKFVEGTLKGRA